MNTLTRNIVATIAYYDVLDYPLTAFEIWKYLLRIDTDNWDVCDASTASLEDVMNALETDAVRKHIMSERGFYVLRGRRKLIAKRLASGKSMIPKFKRIHRLTWWLRFVPYVRMVALTGSLAMKNGDAESDWDMLIVLRPGHIWMGRTLVTGFLHLTGKRRYGSHIKDRACLNYWITSDSLEIITKDLFSSNEYFFLVPLFGAESFGAFRLKNLWIRKFRPNYVPNELLPLLFVPDSFMARFIRNAGEILLSDPFLERQLSTWQKKKIQANPKTSLPGSLIEATDKALIFLPKPQGPRVFEAFKKRMSELESA